MARVVVDTYQFRVISRSVKKTDSNDARLLSLLPEVRMKDKQQRAAGKPDANTRHTGEATHPAEEQDQ